MCERGSLLVKNLALLRASSEVADPSTFRAEQYWLEATTTTGWPNVYPLAYGFAEPLTGDSVPGTRYSSSHKMLHKTRQIDPPRPGRSPRLRRNGLCPVQQRCEAFFTED